MFFKRAQEPSFTEEELQFLGRLAKFLSKNTMADIEQLRLARNVHFTEAKIIMTLTGAKIIPQLASDNPQVQSFINECNSLIKQQVQGILLERFSQEAHEKIPDAIAPHLKGYDAIKGALALQLFAKDPFHILVLGEQGTVKTELLRSAAELAPHSKTALPVEHTLSGLVGDYHQLHFQPGILLQAHKGICVLEDLDNIHDDAKPALCQAMEKGYVVHKEAGSLQQHDTRVSIAASVNPQEDFSSTRLWDIKRQIPLESAVMNRFHLSFLLRDQPKNTLDFSAKSMTQADKQFLQTYIAKARRLSVRFPKEHEQAIIEYVRGLKKEEKRLLAEITPRTVVGIMNMAKASARMNLRKRVEKEDIERVKLIYGHAVQSILEQTLERR